MEAGFDIIFVFPHSDWVVCHIRYRNIEYFSNHLPYRLRNFSVNDGTYEGENAEAVYNACVRGQFIRRRNDLPTLAFVC